MDIYSISIGISLLALFVAPVIYMILSQNSIVKKREKQLQKKALEKGSKIKYFEHYGDAFFGLDPDTHMLFLHDFKNNQEVKIVDLKRSKNVDLDTEFYPKPDKNGKSKIIKLSLYIKSVQPHEHLDLLFYDEDNSDFIDPEIQLQRALKWNELLKNQIA